LSIDQLPSGSYRLRYFDANGKRRTKVFRFKTDARDWSEQIERAKQRGRLGAIDADLQPLCELVAEHFAARDHLAPRTRSIDLDVWASNVDQRVKGNPDRQDYHEIAEMPLRAITPKVIESWVNEKLKEGKGANSVSKALLIMQAAFDRALRDETIDRHNPASLVDKPAKPATEAVRPLSPRQVELIRAQLDGQHKLLVSVLAYGGLRPSEALGLAWRHVGNNTLRIERATNPDATLKSTKTGRKRSVRLLAPLADDLAQWREDHPADDDTLIFGCWSKCRWDNWRNRVLAPAAEAAGVSLARPYDLRHAAASLWIGERSYVEVAMWLGHNPAMTLATYAHLIEDLDPDERVDAAALILQARQDATLELAEVT
jgi:integrase